MPAIASKLKRKLKKGDTLERCGLVLADGSCLEKTNIHSDPERGFMLRSEDMLAHMEQLVGSWHTHPKQTAALSQQDYNGFSQWPQLTHYIIGTDGVRAYRMIDDVIQEVSLAAD
jgi:proteasome lid subunit RPN8/RPN11